MEYRFTKLAQYLRGWMGYFGISDYDDFTKRLEAAVTWSGAAVFAWALIPNHFHLLLRTEHHGGRD